MCEKCLISKSGVGALVLALLVGLASVGQGQPDPVGWWKFDDGSGTTAVDSSGNGYDGILGGDASWIPGHAGGALNFNGNAWVDIPAEAWNNHIVDGFTACYWMYTDESGQESCPLAIRLGNDPRNLNTHTPWMGVIYYDVRPADGSPEPNFQRIFVRDTQEQWLSLWSHWTFVYTPGQQEIYLNGELFASGTETGPIRQDTTGFVIGADTEHGNSVIGFMDDVRLYDKVLTVEEIEKVWEFPWSDHAHNPIPTNKSVDVPPDALLSWREGNFAASHNIYFGTDFNDVNDATKGSKAYKASQAIEETSFDPGTLEFDTTYFWRIEEVNDTEPNSPWRGDVWSFTVADFLVVDDFESYDDVDNLVYDTWEDGWDSDDNGAVVGYLYPALDAGEHYIETDLYHGYKQSLPFFYNTDGTKISELTLPLEGSERNLTRDGVADMSLWFKGFPVSQGSMVEAPAGTYTVRGAGSDIWADHDEFHFVYKEITGEASIIAKVESLENDAGDPNTDPMAKAGIIIRNTLKGNSTYGSMLLSKENGVRNQYRTSTGGDTLREFDPNLVTPYWVKVERAPAGITRFFLSTDGVTWTNQLSEDGSVSSLGVKFTSMQNPIYVGLAVTSHLEGVATEAVFSNVTITGTGSDGPWLNQDVGIFVNEAESLYVAVDDAIVYHDDPNATLTEPWTQWRIPLQDFADQGVDLTDANDLFIGIGTPSDTLRSGSEGQIFIDDMRLYLP